MLEYVLISDIEKKKKRSQQEEVMTPAAKPSCYQYIFLYKSLRAYTVGGWEDPLSIS